VGQAGTIAAGRTLIGCGIVFPVAIRIFGSRSSAF
jgi:hypothetical protein